MMPIVFVTLMKLYNIERDINRGKNKCNNRLSYDVVKTQQQRRVTNVYVLPMIFKDL